MARTLLLAAVLAAFLFVGDNSLSAADRITLSKDRDPGGWFLHKPHEGTLEEMGALFARFAIVGAHLGGDGKLGAVLLETSGDARLYRAEVGLFLTEKPERVPRSFLLRPIAARSVVIGEGEGSWAKAPHRLREVMLWARSVGMRQDGSPRLVFQGDPDDPASLAWKVILPVSKVQSPETEESSSTHESSEN